MSHYEEVLEEARTKATRSAKEYIPKLFHILVEEEKRTPEEARSIIEHDLLEYWSKATVRKYLPEETKDKVKAKAGKEGAKATNVILAGGQTQTVTSKADGTSPSRNDDDEMDKIANKYQEPVQETAEKAKPWSKDYPDMDTCVFTMGLKPGMQTPEEGMLREMSEYVSKNFPFMLRSGWKTIQVTIKVIKF